MKIAKRQLNKAVLLLRNYQTLCFKDNEVEASLNSPDYVKAMEERGFRVLHFFPADYRENWHNAEYMKQEIFKKVSEL